MRNRRIAVSGLARGEDRERIDYSGPDRRARDLDNEPVHRGEFERFVDRTSAVLDRLEVTLFAPDADNCNHQQGLMVTARNIDRHISNVCSVTKWLITALVSCLAVAAPTFQIAKSMGWL